MYWRHRRKKACVALHWKWIVNAQNSGTKVDKSKDYRSVHHKMEEVMFNEVAEIVFLYSTKNREGNRKVPMCCTLILILHSISLLLYNGRKQKTGAQGSSFHGQDERTFVRPKMIEDERKPGNS